MAIDDWREQLQACGDEPLASVLVQSLDALFERNKYSLSVDASERHIAAELAAHMRAQGLLSPDGKPWDVNVEYNRKGANVKTINGAQLVVPDLIVHRIATNQNFLVIEMKKRSATKADDI